jgi:hypothetical protein
MTASGAAAMMKRLLPTQRGELALGTTVLRVGEVPPSLAEALTAKYDALVLPIDAGRADFLAEHAASVRAIVDAGQSPSTPS